MHTCHLLLIEAEDAEEAKAKVQSAIEPEEGNYPTWSDWHGGFDEGLAGRWSGLFEGWDENRDVLQYTENKVLADDIIKQFLDYRLVEMKSLLSQIETAGDFDLNTYVEAYDPYKQEFNDAGMNLWRAQSVVKILNNDWCPYTYIYDIQDHTANLEYFKARLETAPEKQFIVPVDFHY